MRGHRTAVSDTGLPSSRCQSTLGGIVAGGLLGGLAGYGGYAIYDVSASSHRDERRATLGDLRLWASPLVTRRESAPSARSMPLEGATAGIAVTF